MITILKEDLLNYIKSQHPGRKINWQQPTSSFDNGCLMVHYARDILGLKEFICTYRDIRDSYTKQSQKTLALLGDGTKGIYSFIGLRLTKPGEALEYANYGDLQRVLL